MLVNKFVFLFFLSSSVFALHVDDSELIRMAEEKGYGYKYANLAELEKFVKNLQHKVEVPQFVGLSSTLIQSFLESYSQLNIAERWEKIVNEFYDDDKSQEHAFQHKKFKPEFLSACAAIERDILDSFKAFDRKPKNEQKQALKLLFDSHDIRDKTPSALINNLRKSNMRLMVRSTGREDSKILANAGGNLSVSNVNPNLSSVILALGEVVASYFAKTSLKQRLGAADKSLFDKNRPLTPVILQQMIAERGPDNSTKCGVMFTEEPEGALVYKLKNKRITSGITLIQSAYGHNEAVVNSRINVDSFYVDEKNAIFPVIRPKTHRMVPSINEKILNLEENPLELINKPSLSASTVRELKSIANSLEDFYSDAMDVEFVIDNDTIYLVQARPLVMGKKKIEPSYIANPNIFKDKKSGFTIVNAGGALRLSTGLDQIIIAKNINTALNNYFDESLTPDPNVIQGIIVGKMAPATSHEASTFRSEGKPVLFLENFATIEQWLKERASQKLIMSPQQGLVIKYQDDKNSIAHMLEAPGLAQHGWVNYPIPELLSRATPKCCG